ncbi:hypothetical protein VOLCADRAFT_101275, partial [Volvox carteri f. nagariensis]
MSQYVHTTISPVPPKVKDLALGSIRGHTRRFQLPTGKAAAGEPEVKLSAAEAAPRSPLLDGFVRVELDEQLAAAAAAATYSLTSGGKAAGRRGGAGSPAAAVVVLVPAVGLSFTGGAAIIPEPLPPAPGRPWFGHAGSKLITEAWLRYGVDTPASRNTAVWAFHAEPNPSHHLHNYPSILPHLADMSQHFDDLLASGVTEQYDPS